MPILILFCEHKLCRIFSVYKNKEIGCLCSHSTVNNNLLVHTTVVNVKLINEYGHIIQSCIQKPFPNKFTCLQIKIKFKFFKDTQLSLCVSLAVHTNSRTESRYYQSLGTGRISLCCYLIHKGKLVHAWSCSSVYRTGIPSIALPSGFGAFCQILQLIEMSNGCHSPCLTNISK